MKKIVTKHTCSLLLAIGVYLSFAATDPHLRGRFLPYIHAAPTTTSPSGNTAPPVDDVGCGKLHPKLVELYQLYVEKKTYLTT